jgi:enoyl-CoA hydratase
MNYETLKVERRGRVGIVTLIRTEALNALNNRLMDELTTLSTRSRPMPASAAWC